MKIKFVIGLTVLLSSLNIYSQEKVKGTVFIDKNKNGILDSKEKGIQGVSVSNGEIVTTTDEKGNYELPVGEDNIIFVIKPAHYKFPTDNNKLPRFYYIHKPKGSPKDFKYKGVSPTGNIPESVNFALTEEKEASKFKALIFGDPQPYTAEEVTLFEKAVINDLENIDEVSFGISLGDLVGNNLDLHQNYIQAMGKIGIPWFNVIGNHDLNFDAKTDELSDETFENNFGPTNYAFNYGNAHFIILDDILYPDPRDGKSYWAGFRKDQLNFLKNDLKNVSKDKLIVISMHIPLFDIDGQFRSDDKAQFFDILKSYPNVLLLTAHMHTQTQYFHTQVDGWLQNKPLHEYNLGATCGDWFSGDLNEEKLPRTLMRDGTPQGYAYLNIDGNNYTLDYKVVGKPISYQIEIFNPKVIPHNKRTSSRIYANFFTGTKSNLVECRIDDSEWRSMNWEKESYDPSYSNYVARWDLSDTLIEGKRPSNPDYSAHIWSTNIPKDLSKGEHIIEVRATDVFGRTFTQSSKMRVE